MQVNVIVRGHSLAELTTKAETIAAQFFGTAPFEIVMNPWDMAGGEYDAAGEFTNFQFSMVARALQ